MLLDVVLMCHAPIVIPAIARERQSECVRSTEGMTQAARAVTSQNPDVMILVSPHVPRHPRSFGIVSSPLEGHFGRFGTPSVRVSFPSDINLAMTLVENLMAANTLCHPVEMESLDHGSSVPMFFIQETDWSKSMIVCTMPYPSDVEACIQFGEVLSRHMSDAGIRWSLVASGDMSHALTEDAPCGFHPHGSQFDQQFVQAISDGDYTRALFGQASLRANAAEDVVDSVAIAYGALKESYGRHQETYQSEIYSYEGPFGVGYLNARLRYS